MYKPFIAYGAFVSFDLILKFAVCPLPCIACLMVGSLLAPKKAFDANILVPKTEGVLIVSKT